MSDLTTAAGRKELRQRVGRLGGILDVMPREVIALLDLADAGERLASACEKLIERGGAGEDERWWKPWDDAVAEAEAALVTFRSPPPPARAAAEET